MRHILSAILLYQHTCAYSELLLSLLKCQSISCLSLPQLTATKHSCKSNSPLNFLTLSTLFPPLRFTNQHFTTPSIPQYAALDCVRKLEYVEETPKAKVEDVNSHQVPVRIEPLVQSCVARPLVAQHLLLAKDCPKWHLNDT